MKSVGILALALTLSAAATEAATYYMSPTGYDSYPGTSSQPWQKFSRAWKSVKPGDTLVLHDGVYPDSIEPPFGGKADSPITIRALNDGKAVVDGENVRTPVLLRSYRNAHWFVIEGLIFRNGSISPAPQTVVSIETDYNVLRRVSAYNAQIDDNTTVILLGPTAEHNLVEDCVAAGSGRKMISIFKGEYNTLRRCLALWMTWEGRLSCQEWPNGGNIHIYNASNNIVENCIAAGPVGKWSVLVQANSDSSVAVNNRVLGTIAIRAGVNPDDTVIDWPTNRPEPTSCRPDLMIDFDNWYSHRTGFALYAASLAKLENNLLKDILASRNASHALNVQSSAYFSGNQLDHATFQRNGIGLGDKGGGHGTDALVEDLSSLTVTNSAIGVVRDIHGNSHPSHQGEGARLRYRYVDGVLRDGSEGNPAETLWPWPMEQRIREEIGISVTNWISEIIPEQVDPVSLGPAPNLQVTPVFTSFGTENPNKRLVTVSNRGVTELKIDGVTIAGPGAPTFKIGNAGSCSQEPFVLGSGKSCTLEVLFQPTDDLAKQAYLAVKIQNPPPYPYPSAVYLAGIGPTSSTPKPPSTPTGVHIKTVSPD
ncbi:MAG: hypothetical protein EHM61_01125 [Acidobacteria bacterium]|nr:MAG: hypothetical protein EHM61_01125 [Acidobacteriota bacterium]